MSTTTPPDTLRTAHATEDGAGVKIHRIQDFSGGLDPFLMLDELKSSQREDYIGGFPPHPHRGFETITYLIHGGLTHQDSMGNQGKVEAGEAQWMSAGRGVIHSEMPLLDADGLHGFQAWVNLPAQRKMDTPRYRDIRRAEMGRCSAPGLQLTAIAGPWVGNFGAVDGPLAALGADAAMADVRLDAGHSLQLILEPDQRLLAYVYAGQVGADVESGRLLVWVNQTNVQIHSPTGCGLLLLRGTPLREPISHRGPFVMNSAEEIEQAFADYSAGRLATPPSSVL